MKALPAALAAHLATGVTTLCWCWRLARRDGTVQGFTDHDRDLVFDGTTFEASAGFTASDIKEGLGLAVANLDVTGALSSERLAEADLAAGLYDDAKVEIFRVNWQDTAQRVLMRSGSLGEVRRSDMVFAAEIRGLAHYLNQPRGRLYQYTCDADLGDARCTIDLASPLLRGHGAVAFVHSPRRFAVTGLGAYAPDGFTRGLLTFTSGAAQGQAIEVKSHTLAAATATIELWRPARLPLEAGDTFTVSAGCDKHFDTCRGRFANALNFRGFPAMPGNDLITSVASAR